MNSFSTDIGELGVVQSASKIWEKINILRNLDEREKGNILEDGFGSYSKMQRMFQLIRLM